MHSGVSAITIPSGQRRKLRVREFKSSPKSPEIVSGGTKVGTKAFCLLIQDTPSVPFPLGTLGLSVPSSHQSIPLVVANAPYFQTQPSSVSELD